MLYKKYLLYESNELPKLITRIQPQSRITIKIGNDYHHIHHKICFLFSTNGTLNSIEKRGHIDYRQIGNPLYQN